MMFITTAMLNVKLTVSGVDAQSVDKIRSILYELKHKDGTAILVSSPQKTTVRPGDSMVVSMETSLSYDELERFPSRRIVSVAYTLAGAFFRKLKESNIYTVMQDGSLALRYFYELEVETEADCGESRYFMFDEADAIALSDRVCSNDLIVIDAPDWFSRKDFQAWRKEQPYLFGSTDEYSDMVMTFDMHSLNEDDEWEGSHVGGTLDIPHDIKLLIGKLIRQHNATSGMLWIKPN